MKKLPQYLLVAAVLVAINGSGKTACASEYSYAELTLSNLQMTTTVTLLGVNTSTTASASINGSGVSTGAPTDTLQAYTGAPPPAPQNSFVKYSTSGGGPQAGSFGRGDAVMTNAVILFTGPTSISGAAEAFNNLPNTVNKGSSGWTVMSAFLTTSTSLGLSYGFNTDIIANAMTSAVAQASFAVVFTVVDQHGHQVTASPTQLNSSLSAPPNGPEFITSGSSTLNLSLAGLTAGDFFTLTITGTNSVTASEGVTGPAPVPESGASLLLLGIGGLSLLGLRSWRAFAL